MTKNTADQRRLALYARVSTTDQTTANQLPDLRRYVKQRGWAVTAEYVDHGISGAKASRPQLDQLMADGKQRRFDVVLVWRFDRFARSTQHLLAALEEFRALGIDFVSLHEAIDTSTPMGKMVFTICAAVAELERSIIVERVRAGIKRAQAEGTVVGRPRAAVDHRQVQQLRRDGLSVRAIAGRLNVSKSTVGALLKGQAVRKTSRR